MTAAAPVLVVGAGPVGLVTALALAEHGVAVQALEKDLDTLRTEWRGSTLHPATLELLERLGVAATAVAGGTRVDRLQFRDLESAEVAEFDYGLLREDTRFPFRLQYEQYKLLGLLRSMAAAHAGIELQFGQTGVDLEQHAHGVTVIAEAASGESRRHAASWVVGPDGAHSAVRHLVGIGFPGDTYPTLSLVAATDFPFHEVVGDLGPVSYWSGPDGRLSLIRTPDTWRIAVSTGDPAGQSASFDADSVQQPHPALAAGLDRLVGDRRWADSPLAQHQLYRSHQRVADAFGRGRVLLAGDAAHLASTTGGTGLNSGVHDAFSLADLLGPALARRDDEAALRAAQRYDALRRAVTVETIQPVTRAARSGQDTSDRAARAARLEQLRRTAADPVAARRYLLQASMLNRA